MDKRKYIATLHEYQLLKENVSLNDINISDLLNKFITDPKKFMDIFKVSDPSHFQRFIKLSLAIAKWKSLKINNWYEIYNSLKATIDGVDVSSELKKLIYPSDTEKLIKDTDNFLKRLENRVRQRKNTAMKQDDFSNPYGIAHMRITPLDVVKDSLKNPNTKFNYTQYEYAQADLDLQLIKLIKNGDLEVKTSAVLDDKDEFLNVLKTGLKGEELLDVFDISKLKIIINKFWNKNKKEIELNYIEAKKSGNNPILVNTIEELIYGS